jgi:diphosphoinositol-polyphosphate diphosphatase
MAPGNIGDPAPTEARIGRQKQRYSEDGKRLVAGTIPIRVRGQTNLSAPLSCSEVEVLLVSCRNGRGMSFPKGGWEDDETLESAAMRETVEEAGVRGLIEEPMIGTFSFMGGKASSGCIAHMFVLRVAEELEVWPECNERQRSWIPLAEASALCRHEWMKQALHVWIELKGWSHLIHPA